MGSSVCAASTAERTSASIAGVSASFFWLSGGNIRLVFAQILLLFRGEDNLVHRGSRGKRGYLRELLGLFAPSLGRLILRSNRGRGVLNGSDRSGRGGGNGSGRCFTGSAP